MKYQILGLLIIGGIFLTFGDILLKKWALEDRTLYYGIALILYLVGIIFFSLTLKEKNLGVANTILQVTNIITLSLISYYYFHEKLSQMQMFGIGLCLAGVVALELGE